MDGTGTHVTGDCNRAALLLAAHAAVIALVKKEFGSFEDAMEMITDLHDVIETKMGEDNAE